MPAVPAIPPLSGLRRLALPLIGLGGISNLAVLISPIFMMQVLDRVVPSGNLYTLLLLLGIALSALALQSFADYLRDVTLQRSARWAERSVLPAVLGGPAASRSSSKAMLASGVRFLSGPGAVTAVNLIWLPLFFAALFLLHPLFLALAAAVILVLAGLNAAGHLLTGQAQQAIQADQQRENTVLEQSRRQQALPTPQALNHNLLTSYVHCVKTRHCRQDGIAGTEAALRAGAGWVRAAAQLLGLSLGAALVAADQLSIGAMVAASILLIKTVTLSEAAVTAAPEIQQGFSALWNSAAVKPDGPEPATAPSEFSGALSCRTLTVPRGGGQPHRIDRLSFELEPGQCCVILGASGSGKSTLLQTLAGLAGFPAGSVLFDETDVRNLPGGTLQNIIGYLPQEVQLFDATLAENIASLEPNPDPQRVIEAAKAAGVHGFISALPDAYQTNPAAIPALLSSGQRQRIGLARAIFNSPAYLFLDEPNAQLDAAGERQLFAALARLKQQGVTVVMALHRSGLMGLADKVLLLESGRLADFGPRSEVLARMSGGRRKLSLPVSLQSLQDLSDWIEGQFDRAGDGDLIQQAQLAASELFNLALADAENCKEVTFHFRFLSSTACEVALTGGGPTNAARKMTKIASLLRGPEADFTNLPPDEASLAVLSRIGSSFDVQNVAGQAIYKISLERPATADRMFGPEQ